MPSTYQNLAAPIVFDYLYDALGNPMVHQTVIVQLSHSKANYASGYVGPIISTALQLTTDANGYWQAQIIANTSLTPAGTTYLVKAGGRSFNISVPAGAGPFQASLITA